MYAIATLIFTTYVFPFEVTSALLITAALGAMVLAHRERISPSRPSATCRRLRVASGRPAPLPGPGTYARHNAVDMPALLPDGTPARAARCSPVIRGVPERLTSAARCWAAAPPVRAPTCGDRRGPAQGEA